jgi:ATP-dependent DNA ligase
MPLSRVGNAESSAAAHLLTRIGRDSVHKYPVTAAALSPLPANQAYLDGELCGITRDGKTSFSLIQTASDSGNAGALVFFLFDLLYLDGEVISAAPLLERKERLRDLLSTIATPLQYTGSMGTHSTCICTSSGKRHRVRERRQPGPPKIGHVHNTRDGRGHKDDHR